MNDIEKVNAIRVEILERSETLEETAAWLLMIGETAEGYLDKSNVSLASHSTEMTPQLQVPEER